MAVMVGLLLCGTALAFGAAEPMRDLGLVIVHTTAITSLLLGLFGRTAPDPQR